MAPVTRRTFLGSAAALGAALGLESLPGTTPEASAATAGTITDIKHVVVLMQENRSFDHYFGSLRGVRGFGDRATIELSGGHSVFDQPNGSSRHYPWQLSATNTWWWGVSKEQLAQCDGSLDHSWSTQHSAWNNGKMDNWVAAKGTVRTLGFMNRSDIPFHYALADAYTICDAYHCSILSATGPNRTYLWSGTIDPAGTAGGPAYDGGDESGLRWQTYAEALQKAGVSWKVYQNAQDNYGDNALAYFDQFTSAPASSPLHQRGMGSVPSTGSTPDDIAAGIKADALAGTLPQVSWVVANQLYSEHPDGPPENGAHFVNLVIQALAADPDVFNSTVLFLNYDENDGLFDHVPPPTAPSGTAGEFYNGANIGLGFRVPMIIVSPWTRGGWVDSRVYDHTSVLRFLETWTAAIGTPAVCPNISAWRRQVCGDLTGAFDFANPEYGLPSLPDTSATISQATANVMINPSPGTNSMPTQESGTRPARALPYQPNAWLDHIEYDTGGKTLLWIKMANQDTLATAHAHYSVYANAYRTGGPWQYTVAPHTNGTDGSTSDFFNVGSGYGDGRYDLTCIGPNRFLRRFTGATTTAGQACEAVTSYAPAPDTGEDALWFTMTNTGDDTVTFTIASTNYRTDGPWTCQVAAGATVSHHFAVTATHGWYDFTVTISGDTAWSRRATGHIETGSPSVSG
ncbi:phospholipase C, phosphocholine-specific [Streptomyces pluripotens]|uniref:phospholipase C n=1 Tax=Streptomyces pluripotens TaxID=1355015 RepID=A0A221NS42_9ACTN|nr:MULTISPECIES: phospholipase C, phosphocholine-specific [Streptomyces]ASN22791.1 phospholipase C, phosphocholine-specific [Streptomyces pluripotens]KIE25419.1 phospholipase [Streptomyces sp. MUSC 125]